MLKEKLIKDICKLAAIKAGVDASALLPGGPAPSTGTAASTPEITNPSPVQGGVVSHPASSSSGSMATLGVLG